MASPIAHYIHELDLNSILETLKNGAWTTHAHSATPATNNSDVTDPNTKWKLVGENTSGINAFYDINFDKDVMRILDVGGGRYDHNKEYLKRERNIDLLVWDPFNRTQAHNEAIKQVVSTDKVDAATSMSVLNVIAEPIIRIAHIATLKDALKLTGKAYFKIWPGEWPFRGSYFPIKTESAFQANAYADRFYNEVCLVFGRHNVNIHENIPNLIVATKRSDTTTPPAEVEHILRQSKQDVFTSGKTIRSPINTPIY